MVTSLSVIAVFPTAAPAARCSVCSIKNKRAEPYGSALVRMDYYDFEGAFPFFLEVITRVIKLAEL